MWVEVQGCKLSVKGWALRVMVQDFPNSQLSTHYSQLFRQPASAGFVTLATDFSRWTRWDDAPAGPKMGVSSEWLMVFPEDGVPC